MGIKLPTATIQIQSKGAARLSPDLVVAKTFAYIVDKRKRKIFLYGDPKANKNGNRQYIRVWKANERSKSGIIALAKVLRQMGINWKDVQDKNYHVKVSGKDLEIKL